MEAPSLNSNEEEYMPLDDLSEAIRQAEHTGQPVTDLDSLEDVEYNAEEIRKLFRAGDGSGFWSG